MTFEPRHRRGFALVAALFILVMLAGAGSVMVRLGAEHQSTSSFALLGARAYHAARSGAEWALYEAAATPGSCPAATFTLSEGAAAGFDVAVTCSSSTHVEGTTSRSILQIESTADYGSFGSRDYVARSVAVTIVQ